MEYFLDIVLIAVALHAVKVLFVIIEEVIMMRLHKTKWYAMLTGKITNDFKKGTKNSKTKIGFL